MRILLGISLLTLWQACAFALPSDQYQPYRFHSNSVTYDHAKKTTTYIGQVHVTQGSTRITGDKLVIFQDNNNRILHLIAFGKPAHYTTIPNSGKKRLFASANEIKYNPNEKRAWLYHDGKVTQENNVLTGAYIWYDIARGIVHSNSLAKHDHTVVVIQPQKKVQS